MQTLGVTGADPEVLTEARKHSHVWLAGLCCGFAGVVTGVFQVAALHGDTELYDAILGRVDQCGNSGEYYLYLITLSQFGDPKLLERTLDFAISGQVRSQDVTRSNRTRDAKSGWQRAVAWDFVRSHWADIAQAGGPFRSGDIIGSAGIFCSAGIGKRRYVNSSRLIRHKRRLGFQPNLGAN